MNDEDEDFEGGIDALIERAEEALEHGDPATAASLYAEAAEIDDEDREVLSFAIMLAAAAEDVGAVKTALDRLLEVCEDDPLALVTAAGWFYDFLLNPKAALTLLEIADERLAASKDEELRGVRVETLVLTAGCRGETGDLEGALSAAQAALALAGDDAIEVVTALAAAEIDVRRFSDAIARLSTHAEADAEAMRLMGWAHRLSGDDTKAAEAFKKAARASPELTEPITIDPAKLAAIAAKVMATLPPPLLVLARGVPVRVEALPTGQDPPRALLLTSGEDAPEAMRFFHRNIEVVAAQLDELPRIIEALLLRDLSEYMGDELDDDDLE